jgi:hypothetical protein
MARHLAHALTGLQEGNSHVKVHHGSSTALRRCVPNHPFYVTLSRLAAPLQGQYNVYNPATRRCRAIIVKSPGRLGI